MARWAAESTKNSLAATIAVGTVDQAMLAGLQIKYAHVRAAALSRSLLVIDEVHASDHYMTEIQRHLVRTHVRRGGFAMLMSATLGSVARSRWLGQRRGPVFEQAAAEPYPAVWSQNEAAPRSCGPQPKQKRVSMVLEPTMSAQANARIAIEAARAGARVLVIRNTVGVAIELFERVRANNEDLLLDVAGGPALHHSRFAAGDRALLDRSVEAALSPRRRSDGGVIVIGTQTLEQSLDIDADLLVTDLCPIDVLLQRIGRLHRHSLDRPRGFETPKCHVMAPEGGLESLLAPAFVNGLGAIKGRNKGDYYGIYMDVPMLELTCRLIVSHPEWVIPEMNRFLVESATYPDKIAALNAELGRAWVNYSNTVYGKGLAERAAARGVMLPITEPFAGVRFPSDDAGIIRTRLGAEGARITFTKPVMGPLGLEVADFTLPAHWSRNIQATEAVEPIETGSGFTVEIGDTIFDYSRFGIRKVLRGK
jgi:CRISPR-associated endonuclease/helicase Cas3